MEFVTFTEAWSELERGGVEPVEPSVPSPPPPPGVLPTLELQLASSADRLRLGRLEEGFIEESVISIDPGRVPEVLDHLLHKLHLAPVVVLPRTRWRAVLDALTFSLAEHRGWQALDAEATLVMNTRDGLVLGPADLRLLRTVLESLLAEARSPEESLLVIPLSASLLIEAIPGEPASVRIEIAEAPLAKSVRELLAVLV